MRSTTQIWVVKRHQYGISVLVPQTSFRGETSGGVGKRRFCSQANSSLHFFHSSYFSVVTGLTPAEFLLASPSLRSLAAFSRVCSSSLHLIFSRAAWNKTIVIVKRAKIKHRQRFTKINTATIMQKVKRQLSKQWKGLLKVHDEVTVGPVSQHFHFVLSGSYGT